MAKGSNGQECRVLTDPDTGGIPVLFVTALNQIADKKRAFAAGGDDFLTKPIQYAELLARVEALLKVRHLNRDLDRALAYLIAQRESVDVVLPGITMPGMSGLEVLAHLGEFSSDSAVISHTPCPDSCSRPGEAEGDLPCHDQPSISREGRNPASCSGCRPCAKPGSGRVPVDVRRTSWRRPARTPRSFSAPINGRPTCWTRRRGSG
jgi:CheY-like chemotaxis protein